MRDPAGAIRRGSSFKNGDAGDPVKKLFVNLLSVAVVVAVLSFFAAPLVAFYAIRSAGDAGDAAGLVRLIDFTQVRQALRPQIAVQRQPLAPPPSFLDDPVEAVRRRFQQATPPARPNVDVYLTPAALAALTRGQGRAASRAVAGVEPVGRAPSPSPIHWSVNRARLAVRGPAGRTVFTFERRGLYQWMLVHVGLPPAATGAAASGGPGVNGAR